MGLFALVNTVLSTYIYTITAWDVCRPISSSSSSAPFSILDLVRPQSQTPARRTPKRSHARMEAAQREEIRKALKAAIIWLMLKGLEPIFDNSIGYVMPFYSVSKAFVLIVYISFRPELSRHLFDTFVLPIGKPNTPLLDLGAFNSIVLPTARFLLSLPFAHLIVAVKNQVEPFIKRWSDHGDEDEQTAEEIANRSALEYRRSSNAIAAPPPTQRVTSSARQPSITKSSSGSGRSASGRGGDGDGQGGSSLDVPLIRKKASIDSLSSLSRRSEPRPSSSIIQARALLNSLPPAPRDSLTSRSGQSATTTTSSITHPVLQTFAFIPPSTPPSAQHSKSSTIDHMQIFTPRMPGFLGGQAQTTGFNLARVSSAPSSSLVNHLEEDASNSVRKPANGNEITEEKRNEEETSEQAIAKSATRRKRAEEASELHPRKLRATPSKSKVRVKAPPSVSTDIESGSTIRKSASAKLPSSSLPVRSTINRTRKKAI